MDTHFLSEWFRIGMIVAGASTYLVQGGRIIVLFSSAVLHCWDKAWDRVTSPEWAKGDSIDKPDLIRMVALAGSLYFIWIGIGWSLFSVLENFAEWYPSLIF